MRLPKKLVFPIIALAILFCTGIIGYIIIEKWSLLTAIYMTIITLTTVGYGDLGMSDAGRTFTVIFIIVGISIFAYGLSSMVAFIIEGELSDALRRKKMENAISKLRNHYIICGAGDTGIHIIKEFAQMKTNFVVIEQDSERIQHLLETHEFLYIEGDSTNDETLLKAGIDKATGLVICLSDDKNNLFVVLSARELNPNLKIISKAVELSAREKLHKAGADEVILPDAIGGLRMASVILRPKVVSFIDTMLRHQDGTTRFSEATLGEGCEFIGSTLMDAQIPQRTELLVLAIYNAAEGRFIYNPKSDALLNLGDALVVIGDVDRIYKLRKLTKDPRV